MNQTMKETIAALVTKEVARIKSQPKWAAKAGVSVATVNHVVAGKWALISEKMWNKLASAVKYHTREWAVAQTANYLDVQELCRIAQFESVSVAIAHQAGAGKTCALVDYAEHNPEAYYVECDLLWTQKIMLERMYRALGQDPRGNTVAELAEGIVAKLRAAHRPLFIIDEADKLKDNLAMFYISMYNKLDGHCGFILCGAPHLRQSWMAKAMKDRRGFAEIYSRIGRRFVQLRDLRERDVQLICEANGILGPADINAVWNGCEGDLRRVKREIEKLRLGVNTQLSIAQ